MRAGQRRRLPRSMELTELPLAPEICAAPPAAAQAPILAQREQVRDVEPTNNLSERTLRPAVL